MTEAPLQIHFSWLGLTDYQSALERQETEKEIVSATGTVSILGLEHSAVVTLGKSAKIQEELLFSESVLREKGFDVAMTERGGKATLHEPGQLVIYPIMDLSSCGLSAKEYVCLLQKTTLQTLKEIGIDAHCEEESVGVFTEEGKIAFFGLRIQRGITSHGLAINVSNPLASFSLIRSCGLSFSSVDSVEKHNIFIGPQALFGIWVQKFNENLTPKNHTDTVRTQWNQPLARAPSSVG